MASSGPHQMTMGNAQLRQLLTEVRSDCGHASTGPRVVLDQSSSRMRLAISLSPGKTCSSMGVLVLLSPSKAKRGPVREGGRGKESYSSKIFLTAPRRGAAS